MSFKSVCGDSNCNCNMDMDHPLTVQHRVYRYTIHHSMETVFAFTFFVSRFWYCQITKMHWLTQPREHFI